LEARPRQAVANRLEARPRQAVAYREEARPRQSADKAEDRGKSYIVEVGNRRNTDRHSAELPAIFQKKKRTMPDFPLHHLLHSYPPHPPTTLPKPDVRLA